MFVYFGAVYRLLMAMCNEFAMGDAVSPLMEGTLAEELYLVGTSFVNRSVHDTFS
jgi:hypothetical protein